MGDDQAERLTTNVHATGSVIIVGNNATVVNPQLQGQAQQHSQHAGPSKAVSDAPPADSGEDELHVANKVSKFIGSDYLKAFAKINQNALKIEKTPLEEIFVQPDLKRIDKCGTSQGDNNDCTTLYKVFDFSNGSTPSRIWIYAETGKGKTTLCQKYAYDWANSCFPSSQPFSQFKIVVFLRLREVEGTLDEILEREVFCTRLTEDEKKKFFRYMKKHPNEFLFLLDGVSECYLDKLTDIKDFLLNKKCKGIYLIATTCPELTHDWLEMSKTFHSHYYITGYNEDNVLQYISRYFCQVETKRKALIEHIRNIPDLQQLGQIPLILMLICELWHKQNSLPTLTQLLGRYTEDIPKLYKSKYRKEIRSQEILDSYGKMAVLGVKEDKTLFTEEDLSKCKVNSVGCKFGFLGAEVGTESYKFAHKLVQEYFAARWIVENWGSRETDLEEILQIIPRDPEASARRSLLIIISGLLSKGRLLQFFCKLAKCETHVDVFRDSCYSEKTDLLLACVNEAAQGESSSANEMILFQDFEPFKKTITPKGLAIPMSYNAAMGLAHVVPKLGLERLNLSGIMISNAAAKLIATKCLQKNTKLNSVKFSHSCLYPEAVKEVCTALSRMNWLKEVDLSCCYFGDEGVLEIAKLIQNGDAAITSMQLGNDLDENYMQKEQVEPSHGQRSLIRLDSLRDLSEFQEQRDKSLLGDEAIKALITAVEDENELEDLSLPSSCVGNHFDQWLDVLGKNTKLKRIKLHLKELSETQQKTLVKMVNNMPQLRRMSLVLEVEKSHRPEYSSHCSLEKETAGKIKLTLKDHTQSVTNPMKALAAYIQTG